MSSAWVVVLVALVAVLVLVVAPWLSWTANRLDRMHHRIDVTRGTLDSQLLRRSGAALELAAAEALDPPSRLVLLDAAHGARSARPEDFETAQSALSEALRAVLGDPAQVAELRRDPALAPLVEELAEDCARVEIARRVHNSVVVDARELRRQRRVRWFRLAGRAPELRTVDLDDVPPDGLVAGGAAM